jgi:predicted phage-related endonuclease
MMLTRARRTELLAGSRAVPLLPEIRGTRQYEAWRAMRQRSIGASEVASVLGVAGAYSSPFAMWWAKQPDAPLPADRRTEAQEWGHRFESVIADKFGENHPDLYVFRPPDALYRHPELSWLTCTPDRLTVDPATGVLAPLEVKTDEVAGRWGDTPPEPHELQVLAQCAVFGVRVGWLAAVVAKRYREYRLEFTDARMCEVLGGCAAFWLSLSGSPPEVDGHEATRERLAAYPVTAGTVATVPTLLAEDFRDAFAVYAAAKDRRERLKNRMRAAMGDAQWAEDPMGRRVATRSVFDHPGSVIPAHREDRILLSGGGS